MANIASEAPLNDGGLQAESPGSHDARQLLSNSDNPESPTKTDTTAEAKKSEPKVENWASPAVLGLFGFALTTMCIGLSVTQNLGIDAVPGLAMAAAFGGTGQFIGGLIAMRKGEIFPGTVFTCYGCFWWSVFFIDVILAKQFDMPPAGNDMLIFWWMWTLVTFVFLISSWKHGIGICATFIILIIAFLLLDIKQHLVIHETDDSDLNRATGWIIFLCGFTAWFTGLAVMTNNQYGRKLIPIT